MRQRKVTGEQRTWWMLSSLQRLSLDMSFCTTSRNQLFSLTRTMYLPSQVRMGFPQRNAEDASGSAFVGAACNLRSGGFTCPKCSSRVDELPCECHVCGLTLVSSPHLARSYHHLFPIKPFAEVPSEELQEAAAAAAASSSPGWEEREGLHCHGCLAALQPLGSGPEQQGGVVVRCPTCRNLFCFDCDAYIHESLHNCPGCECRPDLVSAAAAAEDGG